MFVFCESGSSSDDETTFGGPRRHHKRRGSTEHGGVTFIIVARDDNTVERGISRIEKCFGKKIIADDIIRKFNRYHVCEYSGWRNFISSRLLTKLFIETCISHSHVKLKKYREKTTI